MSLSSPFSDTHIAVQHPEAYQGVTLWVGDANPVHVDDTISHADLRELIGDPIQRAVVVARLREIVKGLEWPR